MNTQEPQTEPAGGASVLTDGLGGDVERLKDALFDEKEKRSAERIRLGCEIAVKDVRIGTLDAAGHRLALELECLLMDTKDLPTVSRWWDSGMEALEEWRQLFPYNGPKLGD